MLFHKSAEAFEVFLPSPGGNHGAAVAGFQIFEDTRFGKWEFQFVLVEGLQDDHFVSMEAQLLETDFDFLRGFEEVGEEEDDTAPMDQPHGVLKKPG